VNETNQYATSIQVMLYFQGVTIGNFYGGGIQGLAYYMVVYGYEATPIMKSY
jgi:hypothetical protein